MANLVVDASVAVKWFVPESYPYTLMGEAFSQATGLIRTEAQYVAHGPTQFEEIRADLGVPTIESVSSYAPEREVVFGVCLPDGNFVSYVVSFDHAGGMPNPPEAYLSQMLKPLTDASQN